MTHFNNFVTSIKVGGRVLRERGNTVIIPFGSEYSVYIKNLNSVRAQFRLSIDGNDVLDDKWIIVQPNSSVEIERSVRNGNMESGNKFKFIERTENIEKHRGIKAEDGIVRVEYKFEKIYPQVIWNNMWVGPNNYNPFGDNNNQWDLTPKVTWTGGSSTTCTTPVGSQARAVYSASLNDAGITVPGSQSNQKFVDGTWFATEAQSHVITLSLKGRLNEMPVVKPLTVDIKPTCGTCGRKNKATNKFCSECGTSLQLF